LLAYGVAFRLEDDAILIHTIRVAAVNYSQFQSAIAAFPYGKRLPGALYFARPRAKDVGKDLWEVISRAEVAAQPSPLWNLLKAHTDQYALTFLTYPDFDNDPHPALAEATKINLNTGLVGRTDYRSRANPPILHRKETFLAPTDLRRAKFAELTMQEEAAGLYADPSRIGLRIQWLTLLKRLQLTHRDHELLKINRETPALEFNPPPVVERHRTAIKRYDLSKPVKIFLGKGLLRKSDTFFDYGCGHGMDVEALNSLGYSASGWDPVFRPRAAKVSATVVILGYVLNVIEEPQERIATLKESFDLAKRVFLVSTMVSGQETDAHTRPYRDGFLTKTNTFQKFYAPGELEGLIEHALGAEAITLTLGVCIVFKDPADAELFEAGSNRRRIDWTEISAQLKFTGPTIRNLRLVSRYDLHKQLLDEFWRSMLELGRPPEPGEFDRLSEVRKAAGGIHKAISLAASVHGEQMLNIARQTRTEDVLVYLAMTNFRKRFLRREIPLRIRNDIKAFFGDIVVAQAKAKELLFAAGDPGEVILAIDSLSFGVWDQKEMQLTFHRSLLPKLPPILRVYVHCGAIRYGNPEEADLIKIHVRSGKLTLLQFDDFLNTEAPLLTTRIKINLRTQFVEVFDHRGEGQRLADKAHYLDLHSASKRMNGN
jgi:DNA phosphorothioation-associated putative methyltransferase